MDSTVLASLNSLPCDLHNAVDINTFKKRSWSVLFDHTETGTLQIPFWTWNVNLLVPTSETLGDLFLCYSGPQSWCAYLMTDINNYKITLALTSALCSIRHWTVFSRPQAADKCRGVCLSLLNTSSKCTTEYNAESYLTHTFLYSLLYSHFRNAHTNFITMSYGQHLHWQLGLVVAHWSR